MGKIAEQPARPVIDLLILFTQAAIDEKGDWAIAQAYAKSCVEALNELVFPDSGISCRIRLVDVASLDNSYREERDFQRMLDTLTTGKTAVDQSGKFKQPARATVARHRDAVKADLVSLFVASAHKAGLAWSMTKRDKSFAAWAFSVVNCNVADEQFAFAHEIGHNFGCCHERTAHQGTSLTDYGFGYTFMARAKQRHTIMCEANPRLWMFSNPGRKYLGQSVGVAITDRQAAFNAKVVNESAATVAGFR